MPGIIDYLLRYPDTEVSAVFLDRASIARGRLDVGVRIGELADSSMRALLVASGAPRPLCFARVFAATRRAPSAASLAEHSIIASSAGGGPRLAVWRPDAAFEPRLPDTNDAAIEAACADSASRACFLSNRRTAQRGQVEVALEEYKPAPRPIHTCTAKAVTPRPRSGRSSIDD